MTDDSKKPAEKEFEASHQRLAQARREGNVPQSKEANALAISGGILCGAAVLHTYTGPVLFQRLSEMLVQAEPLSQRLFSRTGTGTLETFAPYATPLLALLAALAAPVLIGLVAQQSITFSLKKVMPDLRKVSPLDNAKKRYGREGLLDFAKDTAKLLFALLLGGIFLLQFVQSYYASSAAEASVFYEFTFSQTLRLIVIFAVFQAVLAAIDLPLQWNLHRGRLRMSREEMKLEVKQNEGDPHIKQSRRERASKISRGQMLSAVETASVVMTNPTHYAVALKWDPASGKAPVCVAKGADHMAARIRELAHLHNVPIYSDPPATRSLFSLVDLEEEIRPEHFAAVAAAIQFADRLKGLTRRE